MSESPGDGDPAVTRFYDNYLKCLDNAGIPQKQRRWFVKHIEGFVEAQRGHGIRTLSAADISRYLETIGRRKRLTDWQFRQIIHAIRILYCDLLASPLCHEIDWRHWIDASRELESSHPSQARQLTAEELSHLKERSGSGPLNHVRASHRDLLIRLTTEIRARGLAYRTEQSYEQWLCRFILFCKGASPESVGPTEVRTFLDHPAAAQSSGLVEGTDLQDGWRSAPSVHLKAYIFRLGPGHRPSDWNSHKVQSTQPVRVFRHPGEGRHR